MNRWAWLAPRLNGLLTIGINRAYEEFDPKIIFGVDPIFVRWVQMGKYGEAAYRRWRESTAYKVWLCTYLAKLKEDIYVLKCFKGYKHALRSFTTTMEDGIGHGNNSGYAALNLAACLGANPIYLLGFDMAKNHGKTHWHNGHPDKAAENVPDIFRKHFPIAQKALAAMNIKVINLNPESALKCFPKRKLEEGFRVLQPIPRIEHVKRASSHVSREGAKFGSLPLAIQETLQTEKLPPLFIKGPYGFGDTFYLRSLVKGLAKRHESIYVVTALPEAFWDLDNVKCVRHNANRLRAQKAHLEYLDDCADFKWETQPVGMKQKTWGSYLPEWKHEAHSTNAITGNPRGEESTTLYFQNEYQLTNFDFSFPLKPEWVEKADEVIAKLKTGGKKICVIRPPTIHKEWACYTRNPKPEYFQMLIDKYKDEYFFISVANNKADKEWPVKKLTGINKRFDNGELLLTTLFGLIKRADMVITPPDLFSVLAIAMRTKCLCIFGGCTKPGIVFGENMGLQNFEIVAPDPFCNCMRMEHDCNKEIPPEKIIKGLERVKATATPKKAVTVGIPPGIGDMHWVLTMLESFKAKNDIDILNVTIDRNPKLSYSRDFLRLVPFIDNVDDGQKRLRFKFSIAGGSGVPLQLGTNGVDYIIEFNSRLEHGVRIEEILPKYDVNFNYPIKYPREAKSFTDIIKKGVGGKLYLFYASSAGGNKNWCKNTWQPRDWVELADRISDASGHRTVLMGAQWDASYAEAVKSTDRQNSIQNIVGKTSVSEALGLLRESKFLVGFLSGLVILATRFKIPCVSFWPTLKQAPHWHDPKKFQLSWIPPEAKKDGYMPVFYGEEKTTPKGIFDRVRKYL
jgi:ADP-heptose:LPS heptosyltransferase